MLCDEICNMCVCLLLEKKSVNSLFRKFLIFSSLSASLHKQIIDLNCDLTGKANSSNFAIVFMRKHHPRKGAKLWYNFKVCKRVTCLDCELIGIHLIISLILCSELLFPLLYNGAKHIKRKV